MIGRWLLLPPIASLHWGLFIFNPSDWASRQYYNFFQHLKLIFRLTFLFSIFAYPKDYFPCVMSALAEILLVEKPTIAVGNQQYIIRLYQQGEKVWGCGIERQLCNKHARCAFSVSRSIPYSFMINYSINLLVLF